jgi:outer membrane protein assembly factor BamB
MKPAAYLCAIAIFLFAAAANAQQVAWTFAPTTGQVDVSPALGDLNGDGATEIVVGTTSGETIALDAKGNRLWQQQKSGAVCFPPTIANVTGDEAPEVLTLNRQGLILCLQAATGEVLWSATLPGSLGWGTTALATGDVDGDGNTEIVLGNEEGAVMCLRGTGEQAWLVKTPVVKVLCPAIADLDADGKSEILIGGEGVPLMCLNGDGKERWRYAGEGIGGSPTVYNLDKQGAPEILLGIGDKLCALDATGKTLWSAPMTREMDSCLSIADADGNGEVEIYAGDLSGHFACVSPTGQVKWTADVEERVRRSPSIGDVDGDGINEILVANYSQAMHVFEPDGRLDARVPMPGFSNSTATLAVLGDAGLCVIVPIVSDAMQVVHWPNAKPDAQILWPEFRYDSRRTGTVPSDAAASPVQLDVDFGPMHVGSNAAKATVSNPEGRELTLRLEVSRDNAEPTVETLTSSDATITHEMYYTVPAAEATNMSLTCTVREGTRTVARRNRAAYLVPFVKEVADADALLREVDGRIPKLLDAAGLEEKAYFLHGKLDTLRPSIAGAGVMAETDRIKLRDSLNKILDAAAALQSLAKNAEDAAAAGSTVRICAANPWAPFGGMEELAEGRFSKPDLLVEAFANETESAALNVFNLSNTTRTFRVELEPLKQGETTLAPSKAIALHEAIDVPTEMRDLEADALPKLNSGNLLLVPAWSARQLWLNVNTKDMAPGDWTGRVRLRSLDLVSVEATSDLKITVWNARVPEKKALSQCGWGYVDTSCIKDFPDEAVVDQVTHGTGIFVATVAPKAQFDAEGNLVGAIDFTAHDEYVKRYSPHGIILFCGYQGHMQCAAPVGSEAYAKAHILWLREWVKHLNALGLTYDQYALYPVDEPGLADGLVDAYLTMAKLAREADPKILMYTDPVERITVDELKSMLPYVDIWCPNRLGLVLKESMAEKLDIIKNSGKPVWTYECFSNAKHQSPLGYYRGQAWLAWHHGMTGIGFWSYCTAPDDPWFPPRLRHEYLLIYPGDGIVVSKRWEATRDGIEDYTMLAALAAKSPSDPAAQKLLGETATAIGAYCAISCEPGRGGAPAMRQLNDQQWTHLQETRRQLAALLTQ